MPQEHWSARLMKALDAKEAPSYELLEESVQALLEERKGLIDERQGMLKTVTDMAQKFSHIVFARMNGDTDKALGLLDDVIKNNVTVTATPAATTH